MPTNTIPINFGLSTTNAFAFESGAANTAGESP
jgi:hypothetical protein